MGQTIRVSLPGYDAATDTNPDHYALYADQDWVLIKENARGTVNVSASSSGTITHNLGYIPMVACWTDTTGLSPYFWTDGNQTSSDGGWDIQVTPTQVIFNNRVFVNKTFSYYIFYDNMI